jgi:hypothetical protein
LTAVGARACSAGAGRSAIAPGEPSFASGGVAPGWIGFAWVKGSERGSFMSAILICSFAFDACQGARFPDNRLPHRPMTRTIGSGPLPSSSCRTPRRRLRAAPYLTRSCLRQRALCRSECGALILSCNSPVPRLVWFCSPDQGATDWQRRDHHHSPPLPFDLLPARASRPLPFFFVRKPLSHLATQPLSLPLLSPPDPVATARQEPRPASPEPLFCRSHSFPQINCSRRHKPSASTVG